LRILSSARAFRRLPESGSRVLVRLLATPQRIKRELGGDAESLELGLLRAMWRAAGAALEAGAQIDLDGLPPAFSGAGGASQLLDALQSRQFLEWKRLGGGTFLEKPKQDLDAFGIDWPILERRRRAELAKLDAMQQYAYLKSCRRSFVLRYFGDPAARPHCGGCDICLGIKVVVGKAVSRPNGDRRRQAAATSRSSRTSAGPTTDDVSLSPADGMLLDKLRKLRRAISKEQQVPAFVVFSDRTLAEMALRRPQTAAALAGIRGVGPMKLERYGERFLAVLRDADGTEAA
jgi:ATP-dependent DNA helicase RecQ